MQDTQRRQPSHRTEPGFSSSDAYARRSRWSSASNSRRESAGGGGGRRSWKVPAAVSMNIGPLTTRTPGFGATTVPAGATIRRSLSRRGGSRGAGRAAGRGGGGGGLRRESAIAGHPAPEPGGREMTGRPPSGG